MCVYVCVFVCVCVCVCVGGGGVGFGSTKGYKLHRETSLRAKQTRILHFPRVKN